MISLKKIPSDLKISCIYVVLGCLWILFSDRLLYNLFSNHDQISKFELYKGWLFVALTGTLIYFLIHADRKRKNKILQELKEAKQKAEESDRLKSAFLANISHYLRTPMNSILGFVDLLQNRNLDTKKQEKFLLVVNEQSNHLLQFINNIIEISKLQGSQISVEITEFSLNDLIRKLQHRYQTELEVLNKKNSVHLKGAYLMDDVVIKNDAEKLEYILTNLLSNSVKFTHTGEINFGYTIKDSVVEFFVTDSGVGIPIDKQPLITTTFMHSDPDINKENIGVGLGLAITNGLVKLLKGRLWIEKSDNTGTEFRFTTPINYDLKKIESSYN